MNQTGIREVALIQDTVRVNQEGISIEVPAANRIKLDAPKTVLDIPETPKRFKVVKAPVRAQEKLFIPSAQDSIEFNLKTRTGNDQGFLENTAVRDFLQPVSRSDKQWIGGSAEGTRIEMGEGLLVTQSYPKDSAVAVSPEQEPIVDTMASSSHIDSAYVMGDTVVSTPVEPIAEVIENLILEPEILPNKGTGYSKDILTGLLILSVAITGVIRLSYFKYLREIFSSVLFSQKARKMQKADNVRKQKASIALNGLFLFNAAIFIYEYIHFNNIGSASNRGMILIPFFMAILLLLVVAKELLYRFVAYVFDKQQQTSDYLFFGALTQKIFGLMILPVILVIPYIEKSVQPLLFDLGVLILVLLYLIQLFRGFSIILKDVASLFYLFLYLCALEILPFVIIYSILINLH